MNETANKRMEEWQERIRDYRDSGLTMRAWCAAREVPFNQLKYWLRKLSTGTRKQSDVTWVSVSPPLDFSSPASTLIVRVGGASIDVHPGFDPSLLGQVVRALAVNA